VPQIANQTSPEPPAHLQLSEKQISNLMVETDAERDEVLFHLRRGDKYCRACRRWKPLSTKWGHNKKTSDGYNGSCRDCLNEYARNRHARVVSTVDSGSKHVPPELFPPAEPGEQIGCLRCRHASVQIATDFEGVTPRSQVTVFCHKQEQAIALRWSHCTLADPRPAKPRALAKYWKKFGPLGDKVHHASPLMVEFLKYSWQTWPASALERVTGWDILRIGKLVRYHGIGGAKAGKMRLHFMNPKGGRTCFTPEQTEWLLAEYNSPRWPRSKPVNLELKHSLFTKKQDEYLQGLLSKGTGLAGWPANKTRGMARGEKAAITRRRNLIVKQLAERGKPRTWEQIAKHVKYLQQQRPAVVQAHRREKTKATRQRNRIIEHVATLGPRWTWEQIQRHLIRVRGKELRHRKQNGVRRLNQHCAVRIIKQSRKEKS
jgi:hypothetical protein